jgi:hypothetical protein
MTVLKRQIKKPRAGAPWPGLQKLRVTYLKAGALRESTAKPPPKSAARTEFMMLVSIFAIGRALLS